MPMISGKALLVITHTGNDYYHIATHIQTCSNPDYCSWYWAQEALSECGDIFLPNHMPFETGDRVWLQVTYQISSHRDYYGEYNEDIDATKVRTIKRYTHPYNRPARAMLLTTLLKKAVDYVETFPGHEGSRKLSLLASDAGKAVDRFIFSTDVRDIGTLRDIIPLAFPRKLRTGPIEARKNIHGAWRVDPKEMP